MTPWQTLAATATLLAASNLWAGLCLVAAVYFIFA